MRIRTVDSVNERTADGRVFAAGAGVEQVIDDSDAPLMAVIRRLQARGLAEVVDEKPQQPAGDDAAAAGTTSREDEAAEAALRARADELGIKVDRRWGADRLRAEVTRAEATQ